MDILVFAPESGGIALYRISGQRIWSIPGKRGAGHVIRSSWRDDGKVLAVLYSDGSYQVIRTSNGKPVLSSGSGDSAIDLSWAEGDITANSGDGSKSEWSSSFKLMETDVLDSLPRLQALPTKPGLLIDVKSSENSISNFDDALSVVLTGDKSGSMNLSMFGIFSIDGIPISNSNIKARDQSQHEPSAHFLKINSNPKDISRGTIIVQNDESKAFVYHKFHLGFIQKFGQNYLTEVSVIPAQISILIEYLQESVALLRKEANTIVEANNKFISLESLNHMRGYLFDFLITGTMCKKITKWIESNNEMGYKRWNKTTITSYDVSNKILYENILPAIERLVVLLSRLRGLAKWKERGVPLGLSGEELDKTIRYAECFFKLTNKCLWEFTDEYEKFRSFALWLELGFESVLDRVVGFSRADEPATVRTTDIMKYITELLPGSVLTSYLTTSTVGVGDEKIDLKQKSDTVNSDSQPLEDHDVSVSQGATSKSTGDASLDSIENLSLANCLENIDSTFSATTTKIESAMKKLISVDVGIPLASSDFNVRQAYFRGTSFVLIYGQDAFLYMVRIHDSGIEVAKIKCENTIIQAEFINESEIILLVVDSDSRYHLQVANYESVAYTALDGKSDLLNQTVATLTHNLDSVDLAPSNTHSFDKDFTPGSFVVNGRSGHELACVLNAERQRYALIYLHVEQA
ncbi:hypothetical protein AWJ20_4839 [Sugiyamaella lignohabitans]|uniref:Anaphase-promoting complex subunit 4 n=1 Tax=Sugiyamaella lignohabitans TaxID=796027 RepID=A0A167EC02_9ASCO|nr:uncharacterized protein AWJ20_4839 [Sugiyamaella lignohabitans]ANB13888.1 hypothetical protein AWJ20_4839 [Sugiyamaella lignohabitans]